MTKQQSGFTLIELIMVIVVLAALAVSAIPRYVDLQQEADQASVDGVGGALAAGSAINYAACVAGDPDCMISTSATPMADCADVAATVAGGLPAGYTITPTTAFASGPGDTDTCTVTHDASTLFTTFEAIVPD